MSSIIQGIKKFDKIINNEIPAGYIGFSQHIDQALRWLPMIAIATSDLTGLPTKNKFSKKIKIALSVAILNSITWPLKHIVRRRRPGYIFNRNSFPSGHTSMAFAGAEILRREIKPASPITSLPGYVVAVAAASVRVGRKKHWLSDVVTGAVIGVASTAACYYFFDRKK